MAWSLSLDFPASPLETRWLTATGALSGHLARLGPIHLRVLRETVAPPHSDEIHGPAALGPGRYFIREVLMSIDGTPAVAARSLIPDADGGAWAAAKTLQTRLLAQILYAPGILRGDFAFTEAEDGMPLFAVARPFFSTGRLLARRSVFTQAGMPILVSEGFLPGFWAL